MAVHKPHDGALSPRAQCLTSGREEFDWFRMRREEDDCFAVQENPTSSIRDLLKGAMTRIQGRARLRINPEVKRLRSLPYPDYLQSEHWQQFRLLILNRDHGCRKCGSHKQLDVHHLNYERKGEERKEDVIILCRRCHEAWHRRKFSILGVQS